MTHTVICEGSDFVFPNEKKLSRNQFLARVQDVAMPAVSMSEKLKDHQKSLLHGKRHVTYTNLYRGSWQRKKAPLSFRNTEKRRHRKFMSCNKGIYFSKLSTRLQDSRQDFYGTSVMISNATKY